MANVKIFNIHIDLSVGIIVSPEKFSNVDNIFTSLTAKFKVFTVFKYNGNTQFPAIQLQKIADIQYILISTQENKVADYLSQGWTINLCPFPKSGPRSSEFRTSDTNPDNQVHNPKASPTSTAS